MTRYQRQAPGLRTVQCDDCGGEGIHPACGICLGDVTPCPSSAGHRDCPPCNGSGRVPAFSVHVGDEVEVRGVRYTIRAVESLAAWGYGQRWSEPINNLTLVTPCATPERQDRDALLEALANCHAKLDYLDPGYKVDGFKLRQRALAAEADDNV